MLTYVASPYTHADPCIVEARVRTVRAVVARLLELAEPGHSYVSPVSHSHDIADYLDPAKRFCRTFWRQADEPLLRCCDAILVVRLPGWDESYGVAWERAVAEERGMPERLIFAEDVGVSYQAILDNFRVTSGRNYSETPNSCRTSAERFPVTENKPPAEKNFLAEADRLTRFDRNRDYGHPLDNHTRTAAMWTAYLALKLRPGAFVDYRDVCWMNNLQKSSRDAYVRKDDNATDGCGWLQNIAMAENEAARRAAMAPEHVPPGMEVATSSDREIEHLDKP